MNREIESKTALKFLRSDPPDVFFPLCTRDAVFRRQEHERSAGRNTTR